MVKIPKVNSLYSAVLPTITFFLGSFLTSLEVFLNFQVWGAFQFFNKFFFIYWITNNFVYYLGQIATYGVPSLFRRIEIIFNIFDEVILITIFTSPSSLMQPPFALAMWGVSTSLSIWLSKSDLPYRNNSSSSGGGQISHVSLTCVLLFWDLDERRFLLAFRISVSPWLLSLFLSSCPVELVLEIGVSGRVNANCSCPCIFFIWVDANCSYPWTPISLICWKIFIDLHSYLSTDSAHIFRLVFC